MTRRVSVSLAVAVVPCLLFPGSVRGKRPKPTPCPNQRYVVRGAPVIPGNSVPESIVISGKQVSFGDQCAPAAAKLAVKSRGTRVKARWSSCAGLVGKVKLTATIDPTCEGMTGIVKARILNPKASFEAQRVCTAEQCDVGAVITVDTTTDALGDGLCSFQEAVQAANTGVPVDACLAGTPGKNNTIAFDIPGSGVHTIAVSTVTQITAPITIDGSTQPGYAGVPLIRITGEVEDLMRFGVEATGSALKYLMLTNTNGGGLIDGATALFYSQQNQIVGNYFNTDGVAVIGSHGAGLLLDHSENNVIGGTTPETRNVFGGQTGVYLQDCSHNLVEGNYFGLQADGITALNGLPRSGNGIQIFTYVGAAVGNTVRANVVTGYLAGINLFQGANANVIQGNFVGVAADGTTGRSNGIGILLYGSPGNTIGGTMAAERNVVSGNESTNVRVQTVAGYAADGNTIEGNYIGAEASGQGTVSPNALFGVFAVGGAAGNVIRGNVIAGHEQGVYLDETSSVAADSSQNCIAGNTIYGVNSLNAQSASFPDNWWGDASGPRHSGQPAGVGDFVSDAVTFSPFLTSAPAACGG